MSTEKKSKRTDAYERQRIQHEHGALQRAKRVEARAAARRAADAVDALENRWGSRTGALDRLQHVAERLARLRAEEHQLRQERDELVDAFRAVGDSWNLLASRRGLSRQALIRRRGGVPGQS